MGSPTQHDSMEQVSYIYKHINNGGSHFEIWKDTDENGEYQVFLKIALSNMGIVQETIVPLISTDQVENMINHLEQALVLMKQPKAFKYTYLHGDRVDTSDSPKREVVYYEGKVNDKEMG